MESLVLEHTRSARRAGFLNLFKASLLLAGVAWMFFQPGEIGVLCWCSLGFLSALGLLLLFSVALPNLRARGDYTLRIYTSRIVSESPVPSLAPTFDMPLSEIDHLEHDTRGDTDAWTLVARDGNRYEINHNYRLPVRRVVRILQAAKPPLEVVNLTVWESPWAKRRKPKSSARA